MKKALLLIGVILVVFSNLFFGSIDLTFFSWFDLNPENQKLLSVILFDNRLPRTLLAFFAGMSCSIAGLVMQTIFKNALAGPTTLGINSGASLGMALFYFCLSVLGFVPIAYGEVVFSVIGALFFLLLIVFVALRFKSIATVLIIGILLGYIAFSIIEILVQNSSDTAISNYVFWGMGSFNNASWVNVIIAAVLSLISLFFFLNNTNRLNLYLLGDDELLMSGFNPQKIRVTMIVVCGLLVGVLTSIVGPLAFLGIAIPNFLKLQLKTLNHKMLLPYSAILGGGFAVLADLLSRGVVFKAVYPLNAVLSILAIPIIFLILIKQKKNEINT